MDGPSEIVAYQGGLALLGGEFIADWVVERLELPDDNRIVGHFRMHTGQGFLRITVSSGAPRGRVFRRLRHCHVAYDGDVADMTDRVRQGIRFAVDGLGEWIDQALDAAGGGTIAHALGRRPVPGDVAVLDEEWLRALFAGMVAQDNAVATGWAIEDVYPSSRTRSKAQSEHDLILEFRHQETRRQALYLIGPRFPGRPCLVRTQHFDLVYESSSRNAPHEIVNLGAMLGLTLQLRDHDDLELVLPDRSEPLHLPILEPGNNEPARPNEVLNLALDTECGQRCNFCSVKESQPPEDRGYEQFVEVCKDIADHAQRGIVAMRLNGYDPLSFSHVLETVEFAVEAGMERIEVFSPCTRLADEDFCEALLARVPADTRFFVPLYGTSAEVHDEVVGVPGAFNKVTRALELLSEKLGQERVTILSVVTRANLAASAELAAFAAARNVALSVHLPYPSGAESKADAFYRSAARQSDVVTALAPALADPDSNLVIEGLAPCVLFSEMSRRGVSPRAWLRPRRNHRPLPGTEHAQDKYHQSNDDSSFAAMTVDCAHADRCALAPSCYRVFLRAYVDLHGADEFAPVALADILRSVDPQAPPRAYMSRD